MILARSQYKPETFDQDPLPQLCAATDRLRALAKMEEFANPNNCHAVIDEILDAAVRAEQTLAIQRARIRYLESLSITDELTGLLNRRGFRAELDRALAGARRRSETGLLVLCDLDHFKAINDAHGHLIGDAVLRAVAGLLLSKTRRSDYVARLGGDEFAVLMTHSSQAQAKHRVTMLTELVNSLVIEADGHRIPVTASFGYEGYHKNSQPETLMFLADRALYQQKQPRLVAPSQAAE